MRYGELNQNELETVVGWFLYRMPIDQRGKLMADLPQHYGKLFPDVRPGVIAEKVSDKLARR